MSQKLSTQKSDKILPKLTLILAKVAEIAHWCLACALLIATFIAILQPSLLTDWLKSTLPSGETNLSCYGFEAAVINTDGVLQTGSTIFFTIGSAVVLALMAMIFRNVYLILKTSEGKTWFAKGDTPFQKNITRMFREIGIFSIAISILSLISNIVITAAGGEITTGFNYLSCFIGLVSLCIAQFSNYGTRLEKDLDGLV